MNSFLKHAHQQIETLIPYQAGMSSRALDHLDENTIIKLASNENPLGMSPLAKKAIIQTVEDCARYPENLNDTIKALSQHLNINQLQCIMGNGSENIIALLIQTFNKSTSHILIPEFAFSAYRINAKAFNANIEILEAPNLCVDVEQLLSKVNENTSLIFIDNPNNPIGHYLTHNEIEHILANIPNTTVLVLDEAYYEYAKQTKDYPDSLALQKKYPNLVIIRTFSKIYGLAGLRIGYSIAHVDIIDLLNRVRFPFNVSNMALTAAKAALKNDDFVKNSLEVNQQSLVDFKATCKQLNIETYPTLGNFITLDLKKNSDDFFQFMLKQGIILRPLGSYDLPSHVRISTGTQEQTKRANSAILEYFEKNKP